jgi:hypothetical protein
MNAGHEMLSNIDIFWYDNFYIVRYIVFTLYFHLGCIHCLVII